MTSATTVRPAGASVKEKLDLPRVATRACVPTVEAPMSTDADVEAWVPLRADCGR
jgi:hypothetical protein